MKTAISLESSGLSGKREPWLVWAAPKMWTIVMAETYHGAVSAANLPEKPVTVVPLECSSLDYGEGRIRPIQ